MRLLTFFVTVGEQILFEALDRFLENTPIQGDLKVWYDLCGKPADEKFLERLRGYTKDIIISYENQGLLPCMGWFTLYQKCDACFFMQPDALLSPGYWQKFIDVTEKYPKWGAVGDLWRPQEPEVVVNDIHNLPDGSMIFNRKAIDEVGGFNASFQGRGPCHFELQRRMLAAGYTVASVKGMSVHGGQKHEGRDRDTGWRADLHTDNLVWLRTCFKNHRGYKWWSQDN